MLAIISYRKIDNIMKIIFMFVYIRSLFSIYMRNRES